jgi:tetratricopeptide (TPR) repeat protein
VSDETTVKPKNKVIHGTALLLAGATMCAMGIWVGQLLIGGDDANDAANHSVEREMTRGQGEIVSSLPFEANDSRSEESSPLEPNEDGLDALSLEAEESEASTTTAGIAAHVAMGDEELRAGNYSLALRIYEFALEHVDGVSEAAVRYRIALCSEAEGNFAEASNQYQSVARRFSTLTWAGIARIGEARSLAALGSVEALSAGLMRQVILDETQFSPQVRGELLHVTGRSYCQAFVPDDVTHLMQDTGLVMPAWVTDPNLQLDMIDELLRETPPDNVNSVAFEILQKTDNLPDSIFLKTHTPASHLTKLLHAVCTRSGFACEISDAATVVLSDRTQQLHNDDIRLSLLLDGLCTPFGLTWIHQEGVVRIRATTELDAGGLADYQRAAGKRLLRNALVVAPDSPHASYSRVSMGILQFQNQMFVDAAHSFQLQIQLDPRSDVQAETSFNLGKCFLALGQIDDARVAFLQAVDSTSNNLDARIGSYLYVGRLQLEQGESSGAVSSLVRALAVCKGTDLEPPAALMLSTAYLMDGRPQGANSILMKRREKLQEGEFREAAAFLSSLARFKAAVLPERQEREGRDLVTALTRFKPETQFGAHWSFLHAEACLELGLIEMAVESFLQTIRTLPAAALRERAMLAVAHQYRLDGRLDEAEELLKALKLDHTDKLGKKISLQAAMVALQQGRPDAAVQHCRHVVTESDDEEVQRTALKTMGKAYQQQQKYLAAVYCFAGMLPSEKMADSDAASDDKPLPSDAAGQQTQPAGVPENSPALQSLLSAPPTRFSQGGD